MPAGDSIPTRSCGAGKLMTWQEIGALIGAITGIAGVLTGVLALILNWRTRRDFKESQRPVVEVIPHPTDLWPSSFHLRLRSRSNIGWRVTSIRVLWPLGAYIAEIPKPGAQIDKRKALTPELSVAHAGQTGKTDMMGSGEQHHVALLIGRPSPKSGPRANPAFRAFFFIRMENQNGLPQRERRSAYFTFKR